MSQTVSASRLERATQPRDTLHRIGGMATNDIRRAYGILLVGVLVCAALLIAWDSLTPGVVLWGEINLFGARAVWVIGPLSAGYAAWVAARGIQRQSDIELTEPVASPTWIRELSLMIAGMYWPFVGYLVILVALSGYGLARATWGGPWLDLWFASGCVLLASNIGGFLMGRFWRSRLAPLIAAVIAFLVPSLLLGGIEPLKPLSIQSVAMWRSEHLWVTSEWSVAFHMATFYLTVLLFLLTFWVALRYRRVASTLIVVAAGIAVAVSGRGALDAYDAATATPAVVEGQAPSLRSDIPYACETVAAITVCVHRAYKALQDDLVADVTPVLSVFGGLPGVPTTIVQYNAYAAWDMPFMGIEYRNPEWDGVAAYQRVVEEVFPAADGWNQHRGPGRYSAAQMVVLAAINPDRSISPGGYGAPSNAPIAIFPGTGGASSVPRELVWGAEHGDVDSIGSDHPGAAMNAELRAAAQRFATISPEEQRAWLEANWEALRAGELTLEDLP